MRVAEVVLSLVTNAEPSNNAQPTRAGLGSSHRSSMSAHIAQFETKGSKCDCVCGSIFSLVEIYPRVSKVS